MVAAGVVDVQQAGVAQSADCGAHGAGGVQERLSLQEFQFERFVKPA